MYIYVNLCACLDNLFYIIHMRVFFCKKQFSFYADETLKVGETDYLLFEMILFVKKPRRTKITCLMCESIIFLGLIFNSTLIIAGTDLEARGGHYVSWHRTLNESQTTKYYTEYNDKHVRRIYSLQWACPDISARAQIETLVYIRRDKVHELRATELNDINPDVLQYCASQN